MVLILCFATHVRRNIDETLLANKKERQVDLGCGSTSHVIPVSGWEEKIFLCSRTSGGRLMVGHWIRCQHCNEESLTASSLVENGCCFHCYMKGKGPGELQ